MEIWYAPTLECLIDVPLPLINFSSFFHLQHFIRHSRVDQFEYDKYCIFDQFKDYFNKMLSKYQCKFRTRFSTQLQSYMCMVSKKEL